MSYRPLLKICGVTNTDDARLVSRSGADYCGILVDVVISKRSLSLDQAKQIATASTIPVVMLMCDPKLETVITVDRTIRPFAIQLLCRESPEFIMDVKNNTSCKIWKTIHLPALSGQASFQDYVDANVDALLVDSMDTGDGFERLGGTGKVGDWEAALQVVRKSAVPVFLAGGIGPHNVADALFEVRPFGIDLCSGVEAIKGRKDPIKLSALVDNFKNAIDEIQRKET
ncbi:phosphoribosylanthranilate isomerase [Thermodesulfobacteriota bacterium]